MKKQLITWIDVETTGIDAQNDALLQVAMLITDEKLQILPGSEFERKVFFSPDEVEELKNRTSDYVVNMHNATGLWDLLPTEGKLLEVVEDEMYEHLVSFIKEPKSSRLGGNSITLDRNFINANLPTVGEHLHYRSFDVTSISGFAELFLPKSKVYSKPESTHEAMDDIKASVEEMKYYLDILRK